MLSSARTSAAQRAASLLRRSFQSSASKAGKSEYGPGDPWMHSSKMYEVGNVKHRGLKFGVGILAIVGLGSGIPFFAVQWQQKKAQG